MDHRTESINPYLPVNLDEEFEPAKKIFASSHVSQVMVSLWTIVGVSISGGIFGACFVVVTTMFKGSGPPAPLASYLAFSIFAAIVGTILAFVGACFLVPFAHFVTLFFSDDQRWTAGGILKFGSSCGATTGFLSFAAIDPFLFYVGVFPALVGGLITPLVSSPLAARAQQAWDADADADDASITAADQYSASDSI